MGPHDSASCAHLHVSRPLELDAEEGHLGGVRENEGLQVHLVYVASSAFYDRLHRALHPLHQPLQPHLHDACTAQHRLNVWAGSI